MVFNDPAALSHLILNVLAPQHPVRPLLSDSPVVIAAVIQCCLLHWLRLIVLLSGLNLSLHSLEGTYCIVRWYISNNGSVKIDYLLYNKCIIWQSKCYEPVNISFFKHTNTVAIVRNNICPELKSKKYYCAVCPIPSPHAMDQWTFMEREKIIFVLKYQWGSRLFSVYGSLYFSVSVCFKLCYITLTA